MMAPSVGTIWFPTPTKAWDAARSRVFRLTMSGGASTRASWPVPCAAGRFGARTLSVEAVERSPTPRGSSRPPA